jgi:hypothetical protein
MPLRRSNWSASMTAILNQRREPTDVIEPLLQRLVDVVVSGLARRLPSAGGVELGERDQRVGIRGAVDHRDFAEANAFDNRLVLRAALRDLAAQREAFQDARLHLLHARRVDNQCAQVRDAVVVDRRFYRRSSRYRLVHFANVAEDEIVGKRLPNGVSPNKLAVMVSRLARGDAVDANRAVVVLFDL